MISILDWGAESYHWTHEEMTWNIPLTTLYLYMRENGYKSNLAKPATKRKALWTLSEKEDIDRMEKNNAIGLQFKNQSNA